MSAPAGHSSIVSRGALLTAARVMSRALGLVNLALLAKVVDAHRLGIYVLDVSVVLVISTIATVGMDQASLRLLARNSTVGVTRRWGPVELQSCIITSLGVLVLSVALASGAWSAVTADFHGRLTHLFAPSVLLVALTSAQNLTVGWLRGKSNMTPAALVEGLLVSVGWTMFLGGLATGGLHIGLRTILFARCAVVGGAVGYALCALRPRALKRPFVSLRSVRALAGLGMYLMAGSLVSTVVGTVSDVLILGAYEPARSVARYSIAASLAAIVSIPFVAVATTLSPVLAGTLDGKAIEDVVREMVSLLTILTLGLAALVVLGGSVVLPTVLGPSYAGLTTLLLIMSAAQCVFVATGPCGITLVMRGHHRASFWLSTTSAVISIVSDLVAVRLFGLLGVAAATSGSLVLDNLLGLWFARKYAGMWTCARFRRLPVRRLLTEARGCKKGATA